MRNGCVPCIAQHRLETEDKPRAPAQRAGLLSRSQNQRAIFRDHHGVLELSNQAPVSGSKRPSVRIVNDTIRGDGQEGLNGEDQAFAKNHPLAVIDARN